MNRRGHVVVFALDESRRHLDHGHVGAKPAKHLGELEADVTAADNRQVGGHGMSRCIIELFVRIGNVVEAWQRGYGRTPANVDEDAIACSVASPTPISCADRKRACPCGLHNLQASKSPFRQRSRERSAMAPFLGLTVRHVRR